MNRLLIIWILCASGMHGIAAFDLAEALCGTEEERYEAARQFADRFHRHDFTGDREVAAVVDYISKEEKPRRLMIMQGNMMEYLYFYRNKPGARRVASALRVILRDESRDRIQRGHAMKSLASLTPKDPELVETLAGLIQIQASDGRQEHLVRSACVALGRMRATARPALPVLEQLLEGNAVSQIFVQQEAFEAMGRIAALDPDVERAKLIHVLKKEKPWSLASMAAALQVVEKRGEKLKDPDDVRLVLGRLLLEVDQPFLARKLMDALTAIGAGSHPDVVRGILRHRGTPGLRVEFALWSIDGRNQASVDILMDAFSKALGTSDWPSRIQVSRALGNFGPAAVKAAPLLNQALDHIQSQPLTNQGTHSRWSEARAYLKALARVGAGQESLQVRYLEFLEPEGSLMQAVTGKQVDRDRMSLRATLLRHLGTSGLPRNEMSRAKGLQWLTEGLTHRNQAILTATLMALNNLASQMNGMERRQVAELLGTLLDKPMNELLKHAGELNGFFWVPAVTCLRRFGPDGEPALMALEAIARDTLPPPGFDLANRRKASLIEESREAIAAIRSL